MGPSQAYKVLYSKGNQKQNDGEGNGNPLQYTCLENPMGRRAWPGYSSWGHKEWDITEPTEQAHSLCHMENEYIYLTLIYWDLYVSSSEVKKTNKNPSLQKKQNKMKRQSTE